MLCSFCHHRSHIFGFKLPSQAALFRPSFSPFALLFLPKSLACSSRCIIACARPVSLDQLFVVCLLPLRVQAEQGLELTRQRENSVGYSGSSTHPYTLFLLCFFFLVQLERFCSSFCFIFSFVLVVCSRCRLRSRRYLDQGLRLR